jgi:hypothetical protein
MFFKDGSNDFFQVYTYPTTFNKDKQLEVNPHYTDKRFDKEQTIFGKENKKLSYDYSDRIWEWDYKKAKEATEIANQSGKTRNSCAWFEVYLSHFFGKKIVIEHIVAGVNKSSDYPYCVFGYKNG